jgi:hypothetical protein
LSDETNMINDFDKNIVVPPAKNGSWSNEALVDVLGKALKTDIDLDFLLELRAKELEILVASIRDRIG